MVVSVWETGRLERRHGRARDHWLVTEKAGRKAVSSEPPSSSLSLQPHAGLRNVS